MESPQHKQQQVDLEHQLVSDLQTLRDALTHLSLLLNDLKFEVDVPTRQAVAEMCAECVARSQARQH